MKNLIFAVVILSAFPAFAQMPKQIVLKSFINQYGDHSIHKVDGVQVVNKVEGNFVCLNNEASCDKKYPRDSILLRVSGEGEANFAGSNEIAVEEKTLSDDYQAAKAVIQLKLRGYNRSETSTLVYDNVAYAMWGGSIPFEFNIQIENDLNKKFEEREFRLPIDRGSIFRFKVTYDKNQWKVETLAPLASTVDVTGTEAEGIFAALVEREKDNYVQTSLACLMPAGIDTPTCYALGWKASKAVPAPLAKSIVATVKQSLGIYSAHFDISVNCQKPNQYSTVKIMTCTFGLAK